MLKTTGSFLFVLVLLQIFKGLDSAIVKSYLVVGTSGHLTISDGNKTTTVPIFTYQFDNNLGNIRFVNDKVRFNITGEVCFNDTVSSFCKTSQFANCQTKTNNLTGSLSGLMTYATSPNVAGTTWRNNVALLKNKSRNDNVREEYGFIDYNGNLNQLIERLIYRNLVEFRYCKNSECSGTFGEMFQNDDNSDFLRVCYYNGFLLIQNTTCNVSKVAGISTTPTDLSIIVINWQDDTFSVMFRFMQQYFRCFKVTLGPNECSEFKNVGTYFETDYQGFVAILQYLKANGGQITYNRKRRATIGDQIVCPFVGGVFAFVTSGTAFCSTSEISNIALFATQGLFQEVTNTFSTVYRILTNQQEQILGQKVLLDQTIETLGQTVTLLLQTRQDVQNTNNNLYILNGLTTIDTASIVQINYVNKAQTAEIQTLQNRLLEDTISDILYKGETGDYRSQLSWAQEKLPNAIDIYQQNDVFIVVSKVSNGLGIDFGLYNQIGSAPFPIYSQRGVVKFAGLYYVKCLDSGSNWMLFIDPVLTYTSPCLVKRKEALQYGDLVDVTIIAGYFNGNGTNVTYTVTSSSSISSFPFNPNGAVVAEIGNGIKTVCTTFENKVCQNTTDAQLYDSMQSLVALQNYTDNVFKNLSNISRYELDYLNSQIQSLQNSLDNLDPLGETSSGRYNLIILILTILALVLAVVSIATTIIVACCCQTFDSNTRPNIDFTDILRMGKSKNKNKDPVLE